MSDQPQALALYFADVSAFAYIDLPVRVADHAWLALAPWTRHIVESGEAVRARTACFTSKYEPGVICNPPCAPVLALIYCGREVRSYFLRAGRYP